MSADASADPVYLFYYWPFIPGRGEFVRLALEDAGARYEDVARKPESEGGGVAAITRVLDAEGVGDRPFSPFAPPILVCGEHVISHTAFILHWLGPRLGLAPPDETGRNIAHQLQLTITDFLAETHDVHHPIAVRLYYEEQKIEASRRSWHFTRERMPKFLGYFERVLERAERNGGENALGKTFTYVDTSLFQVMVGLRYAFPNTLARLEPTLPRLSALEKRVAARPRIAAYLASPRRISFNQHGLFRSYPELDPANESPQPTDRKAG